MSQDRRMRRLGRSSDDPSEQARYARERVRQGQWRLLSTADLLEQELVGADRTALAREVLETDWADWRRRRDAIRDAAGLLGETLPARLAADYAARAPQGPEGRQAIEAARAWVAEPTDQHRSAAIDARDAAYAADAAAYAAAAYAAAAADAAAYAAAAPVPITGRPDSP